MSPMKPTGKGRDKIEVSPNSMAKCRACHDKIQKGEHRAGVEFFDEVHDNYIWKYYHRRCIDTSTLRLEGRTVEDELANKHKAAVEHKALVRERHELREMLRRLRMRFAERMHVPPFMIFHDTTLDELVVKMPSSLSELLEVSGFGPKKVQSFGNEILHVIDHFRCLWNRETPPRRSSNTRSVEPAMISPAATHPPSSDDDDLQVGETISCEELVNRKFEHARKNGYMIDV